MDQNTCYLKDVQMTISLMENSLWDSVSIKNLVDFILKIKIKIDFLIKSSIKGKKLKLK